MGYRHYDRHIPGLDDLNGAEHADGVKPKRRIIAAAGASIGAIHGLALLWLLRRQ
jgi:hypothetical protein